MSYNRHYVNKWQRNDGHPTTPVPKYRPGGADNGTTPLISFALKFVLYRGE